MAPLHLLIPLLQGAPSGAPDAQTLTSRQRALRDCAPGPLHTLLPLPSRSLTLVSICFRCHFLRESLPGLLSVPALGFLEY